jgi:DUF4097 and DUF4098 domain-containing protein YvlB
MTRPLPIRIILTVAAMASAASAAGAQQSDRVARFLDNCQQNRSNNEQFCETRDFAMPAGKTLTVDGRENGGITVHGWDRAETKVVAMIQAQAETQADAVAISKQVSISATANDVRATGPAMNGRHESWSVSYEIWAPRLTELTLSASNGGLSVDGVASRMDLQTVNGGLSLTDVAGDVRGTTINGGITADLTGDHWVGSGLDLKTSNGGVHLSLPSNYSAQLETGTVNGGMDIGFPITVQGSLGRRFTTQLGGGGAMIRATTTNGGVTIRRK